MPFSNLTTGQEEIDSPFFRKEGEKAQSFDSIYSQVKASMALRFGDYATVSNYNPTESDVYQITVLFDKKDGSSHGVNLISSALNEKKLGYFKKKDYGNNDYELPYHEVLVRNNIPLNVMYSERYAALHRPQTIGTTLDAFSSPLEARRCIEKHKSDIKAWAAIDELQKERKKMAYREKKFAEPNQQVFFCEPGRNANSETEKYEKFERDNYLRSIRNDIVYSTEKGMLVDELKSSCELNDKYLRLLYLQMYAYHAERSYYNDMSTPIVLTVPVLPPRKELDVMGRVMKETKRPMGVLCVADKRRFLRETKLGKAVLQSMAERGLVEYNQDIDLLKRYMRNFSKIEV